MNTPKKIMDRPLSDDNAGMPGDCSALEYLESTLHSADNDIFIVDRRTTIHWRKRSGIGLCAVAYVLSPGPGRGETVYLSNFNRMVSGKGHTKFRAKLIEAMKTSYLFESGEANVPVSALENIATTVDRLMSSDSFQRFLTAGHRKADHHAAVDYLKRQRAVDNEIS